MPFDRRFHAEAELFLFKACKTPGQPLGPGWRTIAWCVAVFMIALDFISSALQGGRSED